MLGGFFSQVIFASSCSHSSTPTMQGEEWGGGWVAEGMQYRVKKKGTEVD